MVVGYETVLLGTQSLNLKSLTKKKVQGTRKQLLGGKLIKIPIPTRDVKDFSLSGNGVIYETSTPATTQRKVLQAYDNTSVLDYSDGLITGSFIIESLTFNDTDDNPLHYQYTIQLIEYSQ